MPNELVRTNIPVAFAEVLLNKSNIQLPLFQETEVIFSQFFTFFIYSNNVCRAIVCLAMNVYGKDECYSSLLNRIYAIVWN